MTSTRNTARSSLRTWGSKEWQRVGSTSFAALFLACCSFIQTEGWMGWLALNIPVAILLIPGIILVTWSLFEEPTLNVDGRLLVFYPYTALAFALLALEDFDGAIVWSLFLLPVLAAGVYFYLRTHSNRKRWMLFAGGVLLVAAMGNPFGF